jgi:probable F420-dependent oxidoreductase
MKENDRGKSKTEFGVFLPVSGRAAGYDALVRTAQRAEELGYTSVWAADRIVIPWKIDTPYAYSYSTAFIVPPEKPFLEPLTVLAFLAGQTQTVRLGVSVLVLPYRHPVYWAKIASTIDVLSHGRLVLGVGVGWMHEEFETLGALFGARGAVSDEQLDVAKLLWSEQHCSFAGSYYSFSDVAFEPKSFQEGTRIPIWVGGEGKAAQRRAARHGDAWFPYFPRITPDESLRIASGTYAGSLPSTAAIRSSLSSTVACRST